MNPDEPDPVETGARALSPEDLAPAAAMAARAFHCDPGTRYLFPTEARRSVVLPAVLRVFIRYGLVAGSVETAGSGIEALAVWLPPPGRRTASAGRMLRAGVLTDVPALRAVESLRMLVLDTYISLFDRKGFAAPHHYLWVLCTDPDRRNHGLGTAVMRPGCERAAADGVPACLETMSESNVRYYERRGYRVMRAGRVPFGGPPVWSLCRDPGAPLHTTKGSRDA